MSWSRQPKGAQPGGSLGSETADTPARTRLHRELADLSPREQIEHLRPPAPMGIQTSPPLQMAPVQRLPSGHRPPKRQRSIRERYAADLEAAIKSADRAKALHLLERVQHRGLNKGGLFEQHYQHQTGSLNPRKLRDDLRSTFKDKADKLVAILQKTHPLPSLGQLAKIAKQKAHAQREREWPARLRAITQQRAKSWGVQYQLITEWLMDNYHYLKSPNNLASTRLRVLFGWPAVKSLPTSVQDNNNTDLKFVISVHNEFNNAYYRLNTEEKWFFYAKGAAREKNKKRLLSLLNAWKSLFTITKGKMAQNFRTQIKQRIASVGGQSGPRIDPP